MKIFAVCTIEIETEVMEHKKTEKLFEIQFKGIFSW